MAEAAGVAGSGSRGLLKRKKHRQKDTVAVASSTSQSGVGGECNECYMKGAGGVLAKLSVGGGR